MTVQLVEQVVHVSGNKINQSCVQRFLRRCCFGRFDGFFSQSNGLVAALSGQRAYGCLERLFYLGGFSRFNVFALRSHRTGRTDDGVGRHSRKLAGKGKQRPRRRRHGPLRRDVDHYGYRALQDDLHQLVHQVNTAAGRVQFHHDHLAALIGCQLNGTLQDLAPDRGQRAIQF
ncbi:hypothetical protein SDC9_136728 [bioreactor metagenome]|uniref:Uncharacterized protein n=1 Tax=bioreactor metagenome TaxID=1076179 RepID=A0A645DJY4_9ZZZZ